MGSVLSLILCFPVKDISFKQKFSKIGALLAGKHCQVRALRTLVLSKLVHYQSTAAVLDIQGTAFPSELSVSFTAASENNVLSKKLIKAH